ncbi:MAG: hypothetical protein PUH99_04125, partial [Firmicutes bacterium]|nr:hypothetical protein [Bacillota bacterium]MDY5530726.1 hypothetical protein [Pumilibacteraceae bacterium]
KSWEREEGVAKRGISSLFVCYAKILLRIFKKGQNYNKTFLIGLFTVAFYPAMWYNSSVMIKRVLRGDYA